MSSNPGLQAEPEDARPATEVAGDLAGDVQRIVELQVALAKQELRELAVANAVGTGMMGAGGLLVALAVLVALPVTLVMLLPWHWQAALVWLVAYLVLGAIGLLVGRARLRLTPPRRTLAALKETGEWALRRIRSPIN